MALYSGQMADDILVSTRMGKVTAMVRSSGQMEPIIVARGKTESNMELEFIEI